MLKHRDFFATKSIGRNRQLSMLEVAHAGQRHGDAMFVAGGDDFVVADGTAGLDDEFRAHFVGGIDAVGKREERLGDKHAFADDLLDFLVA